MTLLGQNVNSYGRDLPAADRHKTSFSELLPRVDAVDGIERIRYTSPHPKDMKEDVIRAHAELPSLCEHIHLPLQSGSSAVLKRMRRTYNRERYMDRVALIREHVPDCAITTDIIVGFPGETEEDFARDPRGRRRGRLRRRLHLRLLAPPRDRGRRAWTTRSRTPSRRSAWSAWSSWSSGAPASAPSASSGRTMEVLVEGPSRNDPARLRGRIRHNKTVNFDGTARARRAGRGRDHRRDLARR